VDPGGALRRSWSCRAHGGETAADLWNRIDAAWRDLLRDWRGERVLVVTHAAPIQLLVCAALGPLHEHARTPIPLGSLTRLDVRSGRTAVGSLAEIDA